jgi:HPt (histidine-containing phosphotransfer) domain-containing protein
MSVPNELRILYIRSAAEKLAMLERLWAAAEAGYWRPDTVAPLKEFAHRLAGSGGSYGFRKLGDTARELELALDDLHSPSAAPEPARQSYQALRAELESLAAAATG